jgi:hypothetical protein
VKPNDECVIAGRKILRGHAKDAFTVPFEISYLRDATELAIKQNNTHHLLMKSFHVEVGFINRFGVVEWSRQSVLSLCDVGNRKTLPLRSRLDAG